MLSPPVILRDSTMTSLHDRPRQTIKAVVFDVGGVLIDLHSDDASRELIEKYGLRPETFARMTRSSFESHPRSITELAMIGYVGTSEYLDAFLHECGVKDLEALRLNRLSVVASYRIKCAKPTQESFLFVANALNIQMSECLLVDDTPLNVDRAEAAGWQALLFRDAAQLKRDLNDLLCY